MTNEAKRIGLIARVTAARFGAPIANVIHQYYKCAKGMRRAKYYRKTAEGRALRLRGLTNARAALSYQRNALVGAN